MSEEAAGRLALPMSADAAGLCGSCVHLRLQASKTSVFVRCGLAEVDSRFPKYPPLPVRMCGGYKLLAEPGKKRS